MATHYDNIISSFKDADQWINKYPWFAAAHFIAAKKSLEKNDGFEAAQKAAVYFNDIQRLHFLLHEQPLDIAAILAGMKLPVADNILPKELPIVVAAATENEILPEDVLLTSTKEEDAEVVTFEEEVTNATVFDSGPEEIRETAITAEPDTAEAPEPEFEAMPEKLQETEIDAPALETEETSVFDSEPGHKDTELIEAVFVKPEVAIDNDPFEESDAATSNETDDSEPEPIGQISLPAQPFDVVSSRFHFDNSKPAAEDPDDYDPDDTDGPEDAAPAEPELVELSDIDTKQFESESLSNVLAEVSKQFKEEPVDKDAELVIESEPYHTIDYFASQGIKLEAELKPDDKFGHQLKTFTSWLKHMKKLPATKMAEKEPDPVIENIAQNSLVEGEVVTESMAEVLLKQGKTKQAMEVWEKLSLLHPDKSHYFATLIDQFKV